MKEFLLFLTKSILISAIGAMLIFGCIKGPAKNEQLSLYPQMATPEMESQRQEIRDRDGLEVLGTYTDNIGGWIFWFEDIKTGKCIAYIVYPGVANAVTCEKGFELYRTVCMKLGNCI